MKKTLIALILISTFLATTPLVHAEEEPMSIDLMAGQNIDAGDVQVWNDSDNLYVKYTTENGWCLSETHLHVAGTLGEIPQTKKGNPIPGQFDYKDEVDCETEWLYTIPLPEDSCGDELVIAAHAVVIQKDRACMNVVSDADVMWSADASTWQNATACWVHPNWNDVAGATWIWRTEYTDPLWEYNNVPEGGWHFKKEFTVPGTPTSGEISINADNSYSLALNGVPVGSEGSMDKDGPDNHEWATIDNFGLGNLVSGLNSLEIRALNFFNSGTQTSNPAGLAFNAEVCYEEITERETAWGEGTDFPGNNWAMYFPYQVECTITFPDQGTAYIGYEDRTGGDFDYNDFGMNMAVQETYVNNCLKTIDLEFTSLVKKAGDVHDIHILRTLNPDVEYSYDITRSSSAQGTETPAGTGILGSGDLDITLFDSIYFTPGDTVSVQLEVSDGCQEYAVPTPPRFDLDPVFGYYDPWMKDKSYGPNNWHIADTQPTTKFGTPSINVPYILVVPYTDWPAPGEGVTITGPYPDFDDYYRNGSPEDWYLP